jgi:hypothetical protein
MWKELSKIALLGTERSHLSDVAKENLTNHGIHMDAEETQILLESAAFFSQIKKAAFLLPKYEGKIIETAEDANEEEIASPKSTHHLSLILNGEYERALPEFIANLEKNKKQLSPKNLPDLLNKSLESRAFWKKIKLAIGKRGWWLLAQNPVWQTLERLPSPDTWAVGTKEERVAFLTFFREQDTSKTLDILSATWEKESWRDKVDFLQALSVGLSKTDEAFLEDCLYDGRKEIRETAASLLAAIPDSELVERMYLRLEELIHFDNDSLKINLPDLPDETAIRDGVNPKSKKYAGQKMGILYQMLSKVPPSRWERFFDGTPEKVLKLFYQNDWSKTLIQGMVEATILHKNRDWAKPLLEMWLHLGNSDLWESKQLLTIAEILSPSVFNKITIQHLEKNRQLLNEKSPVLQLLIGVSHAWNDHLAMLAIGRFQQWLAAAPSHFWDKIHYKTLLHEAAYKCSPNLLEKMKSGWGRSSQAWGLWEAEVEQFLRVLIFRKEMLSELAT